MSLCGARRGHVTGDPWGPVAPRTAGASGFAQSVNVCFSRDLLRATHSLGHSCGPLGGSSRVAREGDSGLQPRGSVVGRSWVIRRVLRGKQAHTGKGTRTVPAVRVEDGKLGELVHTGAALRPRSPQACFVCLLERPLPGEPSTNGPSVRTG